MRRNGIIDTDGRSAGFAKKSFYVLRLLLSVRWLLQLTQPASIEFSRLSCVFEGEPGLLVAIDELLELKRSSPEMGLAPQVGAIQAFIEAESGRQERSVVERDQRGDVVAKLSALFRDVLRETWG